MQWCLKNPHPKSGDQPLPAWGLWLAIAPKLAFGYQHEIEIEKPIRVERFELAFGCIGIRLVKLRKA
jgi:hypothetical protein